MKKSVRPSFKQSVLIPESEFKKLITGVKRKKGKGKELEPGPKRPRLLPRTQERVRNRRKLIERGNWDDTGGIVRSYDGGASASEKHITRFFPERDTVTVYRIVKLLRQHPDLISWDEESFQTNFRGEPRPGSHLIDLLSFAISKDDPNLDLFYGQTAEEAVNGKVLRVPNGFGSFYGILKQVLPQGAKMSAILRVNKEKARVGDMINRRRTLEPPAPDEDDEAAATDLLSDIARQELEQELIKERNKLQREMEEALEEKMLELESTYEQKVYDEVEKRVGIDTTATTPPMQRREAAVFSKSLQSKIDKEHNRADKHLKNVQEAIREPFQSAPKWKVSKIGKPSRQLEITKKVKRSYRKAIDEGAEETEATSQAEKLKTELLNEWISELREDSRKKVQKIIEEHKTPKKKERQKRKRPKKEREADDWSILEVANDMAARKK